VHGRDLDVVALAHELDDAVALMVVVLDQQELRTDRSRKVEMCSNAPCSVSRLTGFSR